MKFKKILCVLSMILCLSSCDQLDEFFNSINKESSTHVHTYSDVYSYDDSYHWMSATCIHSSEVKNYEKHNFSEYYPIENSLDKYEKCDVCGYIKVSENYYNEEVSSSKIDGSIYTLNLTNSDNVSFTFKKDDLFLNYHNFENSNTSHVILNKNGYISLKTCVNDILSFKVNYTSNLDSESGWGDLYYCVDNYYISEPFSYYKNKVISNELISFSSINNYICFFTYNTINIESISLTYKWGKNETNITNRTINLIGTNDIHGAVNKTSSTSGLEEASEYINNIKKSSKYNILLDQGDLYQGSSASYYTDGRIMNDYLMSNGYTSTIVGNHEFDNGTDKLASQYDYLDNTVVLANNIRYKDSGLSPSWVKNYTLIERCGVKIGIIGSIGDVESSISSSAIKNIKFLTGDELTNQIINDSNALKALGADFIILSIHDGGSNSIASSYDLSLSKDGYIDLVLEAHSHSRYSLCDEYGVYHVQNGGYLGSIYNITLNIDSNNKVDVGTIKHTTYSSLNNLTISNDNLMNSINNWFNDNVYGNIENRVITTIYETMDSSSICPLIAEGLFGLRELVSEYNITLATGFMKLRTPYYLYSGEVTYGDITNLLPFDNNLQVCSINGSKLKSLINRTNYYTYPSINSSSLVASKTYYIITDSYTSDYAINELTVVKDLTLDSTLSSYGKYERDILAAKLKEEMDKENNPIETDTTIVSLDYTNFKEGSLKTTITKSINSTSCTISMTHSSIIDNSYYSEFNLAEDGYLTIKLSGSFIIEKIEVKIYSYGSDDVSFSSTKSLNTNCDYKSPRPTYSCLINDNTVTLNNESVNELNIVSIKLYIK